jgi:hypothetical protein
LKKDQMRGGRRPGAGRKPGGKNKATLERELRLSAVPDPESGERPLAKDVLSWVMSTAKNLALNSYKTNDTAGFIRWSTLARDAAQVLINYECPKLVATTVMTPAPRSRRFTFNIFSADRTPLALPSEVPAIASHTIQQAAPTAATEHEATEQIGRNR